MSDDLFQRAGEIFEAALAVPAGQRAALARSRCGDDGELLREVLSLLSFHHAETTVLSEDALRVELPTVAPDAPLFATAALPRRFGRYELLRVLGQGGMGLVFEAEQDHPRRTVALKVIRPDLVGTGLARRFRLEADVLAQLQHPGIAQIYDAGVSDDGQPFFAMELVRGVPLTEFASRRALHSRDRLELFAAVCDAVHHAHERGIVHRDLKPANILVSDDATERRSDDGEETQVHSPSSPRRPIAASSLPKILDFGVARIVSSDSRLTVEHTNVAQIIGTVPYMSPEQIAGDSARIDARSDVYALGVILFELLAGRLPIDVRERPIIEAARMIRDDEPARLSAVDPRFRGDVETIVSKAIEKDRERRYPSAGALAADIRRHLRDEPIVARPATTWYQLTRFARRHRELVIGLAATFVALLGGLIGVGFYALRESDLRRAADSAAERSRVSEIGARRAAYRAGISAAAASIINHDIATARRDLDAAPKELRGWEWHHFRARLDQSRFVFEDVAPRYASIGFSDGGGAMFVADGRSFDAAEQMRATARSLADGAAAARSPDDASLVRAFLSPVQMVSGWERSLSRSALEREPLRTVLQGFQLAAIDTGKSGGLLGPVLSADGSRLAAYFDSNADGTQLVVVTRREGDSPNVHYQRLARSNARLLFSPDGQLLWTGDEGNIGVLRDGATGQPLRQIVGHTGSPMGVAFSPDGKHLLTGGWDATLRLWSIESGETLAVGTGHDGQVDVVAISPDGKIAASGARDGTIRLWRGDDLAPIDLLHGHGSDVRALAFAPDGRALVSAGRDGAVRVWDLQRPRGDVLTAHTSYVYPIAFHPTRPLLVSGSWDGTLRLWNFRTGEAISSLTDDMRHVFQAAFDAHGERLLTWSDEGIARVWSLSDDAAQPSAPIATLKVPMDRWSPRFGDDGRVLLSRVDEQKVRWWNPDDGSLRDEPLASVARVGPPLVSADGQFAMLPTPPARSSDVGKLELVGLRDGRSLDELSKVCQRFAARGILGAFAPDSRYWIAADNDHVLRVLDLHERRYIGELRGHVDQVFAIAVSPDGSRAASAGRERVIRIWDLPSREQVAELRGHTSYVWALAWSPDGSTLASSSGDFTVRLWRSEPR